MTPDQAKFLAQSVGAQLQQEWKTTYKGIAAWYKHEFPKVLEKVLALDGQHLSQIVEAFGVLKLPSAAFVLFCNNHMVHHRGQLSTYLRAMGSKVPAIYGNSFDEKMQM